MNLQQLRYVAEVAQRNLNVSEAARALHTSQSGVSRQISLLESELGVDVFIRQGKRLVAMTRPGEEVVAIARDALRDIDQLGRVGPATGRRRIRCRRAWSADHRHDPHPGPLRAAAHPARVHARPS